MVTGLLGKRMYQYPTSTRLVKEKEDKFQLLLAKCGKWISHHKMQYMSYIQFSFLIY